MMALLQRVSWAKVSVEGETVGVIGPGLLVFLGIKKGDTTDNSQELSTKVLHLRIFRDELQKMNKSLLDVAGELLVVSQFTLYGNTIKGNRPSFSRAAAAEDARFLYEDFISRCKSAGVVVASGMFQAQMNVELSNDGPVTLLCKSENDSEL